VARRFILVSGSMYRSNMAVSKLPKGLPRWSAPLHSGAIFTVQEADHIPLFQ
jgi:hypothetical protein